MKTILERPKCQEKSCEELLSSKSSETEKLSGQSGLSYTFDLFCELWVKMSCLLLQDLALLLEKKGVSFLAKSATIYGIFIDFPHFLVAV